jgi:exodeoxyribonuclease VII small subunit
LSEKSQDKIPADIKKLNFEDALEELEDIVRTLEEGSGALDDAIKAYERGAMLKKHCEQKLIEARTRVEKVVIGPDGEATSEPVDID